MGRGLERAVNRLLHVMQTAVLLAYHACVCVCVGGGESEGGYPSHDHARVCVCVRVYMSVCVNNLCEMLILFQKTLLGLIY